jgi:cytidylate kinase
MKIITISREFGAGGGEVARRLADTLGWELLDRNLLHQAATLEHVPDTDLERMDEQAVSIADHFRLHPSYEHYFHGLKEAVQQAAVRGNIILVGRGTRQLLADTPDAFHLRLVAPKDWRARRMAQMEHWSFDQALARCTEVDRMRERFTRYFFGATATHPAQYDLVVNTGRVALDRLVACVAAVVRGETAGVASTSAEPRVLTLSREIGAGDTGFAQTMGARLGLRVYDRELLEQEAVRLHVTKEELETIDEQPAGIFQRIRPGSLGHRYSEALGQLMKELADSGNVLLVGRGGSVILRDHARAFHVRLIATIDIRIRRVMEHRWLRKAQARELIARSDAQRSSFYRNFFEVDWSDPLGYHVTVNSGRLSLATVDLVADAALNHWGKTR